MEAWGLTMTLRFSLSGTSPVTAAARTTMRAEQRAAGATALNWPATMALLLRVACILVASTSEAGCTNRTRDGVMNGVEAF